MLVVMKKNFNEQELEGVMQKLTQCGLTGHLSHGVSQTVVGVVGQTFPELRDTLELLPGVEEVIPISKPHKLSSREFKPEDIGITPIFFDYTFFCRACGHMASDKTCPHDASDHVFLSGTKVREMLKEGKDLPDEFTRPEISKILMDAYATMEF